MATSSFEQTVRSSSSKEHKRNIFGSILRHLAPQVQVEGGATATSGNYASIIMLSCDQKLAADITPYSRFLI
ncbi:uncharacterized protein SAPINGB_P005807 [Magnusiomyces paraingens]|uniref:Uncharacterized protein n=1 Tax=Magnusiomyces paraingens TaxID=2606893 RepID=A0A5E8C2T8_9ASCO|nr:uncharacterized protein SAPINGB_P005807 [Saprochaete ingens]VVT57662.1 unnamed protein product [Saprochaete ingens]